MANIGLTRDNIQIIINAAHVKIDEYTDKMANRYFRGTDYESISNDMFEAINIIKVLEDDSNLSDDSVEHFLDRLIKITNANDTGYNATTLQIVENQPAIQNFNILGTISGPAFTVPYYNIEGNDFEPSPLSLGGGSALYHTGSVYEIGFGVSTSAARAIRAGGTDTNVSLLLAAKGAGQLQLTGGGGILLSNATQITGNFSLSSGGTVNVISTDLTTAAATEIATASAIKSYADTLDTAARAYTDSLVVTANNGVDKIGNNIVLGGALTGNTEINIGTTPIFTITNTGNLIEFNIDPSVGFTLKSVGGTIAGDATNITVTGLMEAAIDESGGYTVRSYTDKSYQDGNIAGNQVTALVQSPGLTENNYSISWDNGLGQWDLKPKGTAGGLNDATTLNGFSASDFLKVATADAKTKTQTYTLTGETSGTPFVNVTVPAADTGSGARLSLLNTSNLTIYDNTLAQSAKLTAYQLISDVAIGTPPLVVTSTTAVPKLNVDQVDGYDASIANTDNNMVVRGASGDILITSINGVAVNTYNTSNTPEIVENTKNSLVKRDNVDASIFATKLYLPATEDSTSTSLGLYNNTSNALVVDFPLGNLVISNDSTQTLFLSNRNNMRFTATGGVTTDFIFDGQILAQSEDVIAFNSDLRKKDYIETLEINKSIEAIYLLDPISYQWKHSGKKSVGFGAQEVMNAVPEAVVYDEKDDEYYMHTTPIVAHLVRVVQELMTKVNQLEEELTK